VEQTGGGLTDREPTTPSNGTRESETDMLMPKALEPGPGPGVGSGSGAGLGPGPGFVLALALGLGMGLSDWACIALLAPSMSAATAPTASVNKLVVRVVEALGADAVVGAVDVVDAAHPSVDPPPPSIPRLQSLPPSPHPSALLVAIRSHMVARSAWARLARHGCNS